MRFKSLIIISGLILIMGCGKDDPNTQKSIVIEIERGVFISNGLTYDKIYYKRIGTKKVEHENVWREYCNNVKIGDTILTNSKSVFAFVYKPCKELIIEER